MSGGATAVGGSIGAGGTSNTGGAATGGVANVGGAIVTGGSKAAGGANVTGGNKAAGGANVTGGYKAAGGANVTGGSKAAGGAIATGGSKAWGGGIATGGSKATGGAIATGGIKATGGAIATGGTKATATGGRPSLGGTGSTGGTKAAGGAASGGAVGTGGQASAGSTGTSNDPGRSPGCSKTPSLKTGTGLSITVGGSSRTYNLKVPDPYDNTHPYRLIMAYHWLGGTANDVTNGGVAKPYYGLWDLAQGSTIFVAPQGLNNGWSNSSGADVEFSRQLITLIENEFCIDTSRIFCEGFSMGGSMSYALACSMGDVVRAVAVHSGGPMSGCVKPHDKPVAYFMTHGTNDSVCTYPGYGVPELQDFAKTNGCTSPDPALSKSAFADAMPDPTDSSGKTPLCVDFTGCQAGYPTRACIFVGDHTPSPGGTSGWVPTETWKFLSQF
jgi:hypothetical protein